MSMNFGRISRSAAFDPTTAFPLDVRSYFESYDAAEAAAASAQEVGSSATVYYYGQTLAVVENNRATLYIIQPNKTLSPIEGSSIEINTNQFYFDSTGKLNLLNFESAEAGQMLILGNDNKLAWITPVDTYSKTEIDSKLASVGHLKRIVVSNIQEIEDNYLNETNSNEYIFMIPSGLEDEANKYYEYIILELFDSEGISTGKIVEKIGSWEVDLSTYATKASLSNYIEKPIDGSRLITSSEIEKLENLSENAEQNYIDNVSEDFIVTDRKLLLNRESALAGLVKTTDTDLLVSATDRQKLNSLIIGDENNLEISGKVHIDNVTGIEEWLNNHASNTPGLSEINFSQDLYNQLQDILRIKTVSDEFTLNNQHLSINEISRDKITGLKDLLDLKADQTTVQEVYYKASDIETSLAKEINRINALEDHLTWKNLD